MGKNGNSWEVPRYDFFQTGHSGTLWDIAPPLSDQDFKVPAMRTSRGETQCPYNYRARCAPGLPMAQHLFAKLHWLVGIDENNLSGQQLFSSAALRFCALKAQRFAPD